MTSTNPRLLAIRRSLAECDSHSLRRGRIQDWIDLPARMHRWYKIPGTKISPADLKQSKRVLRLWLAVYGSGMTPEREAAINRAFELTMEQHPFTEAEKAAQLARASTV